jgi:hypothetical protein
VEKVFGRTKEISCDGILRRILDGEFDVGILVTGSSRRGRGDGEPAWFDDAGV